LFGKFKFSLKWSFIFVIILGIAFSFIIIFLLMQKLPVEGSSVKASSQPLKNIVDNVKDKNLLDTSVIEQTSPGLPVRLKIPKIKVNAAIEYVGLTSTVAVGVPAGPVKAAWYDLGPRPGEKGNAIIVGHFGWKNNIPAVFDNLSKLRKGDKILVEDDKGVSTSFIVREIKSYHEKAEAMDVFISKDGKQHLNLITCVGVWNKVSKSFSKRLVVFADKEE